MVDLLRPILSIGVMLWKSLKYKQKRLIYGGGGGGGRGRSCKALKALHLIKVDTCVYLRLTFFPIHYLPTSYNLFEVVIRCGEFGHFIR